MSMSNYTTLPFRATVWQTGGEVNAVFEPSVAVVTTPEETSYQSLRDLTGNVIDSQYIVNGWVGTEVEDVLPSGEQERKRLREMERRGEIELGPGGMPEDFWDMPRPEDPEGLVRQAVREDRDSGL